MGAGGVGAYRVVTSSLGCLQLVVLHFLCRAGWYCTQQIDRRWGGVLSHVAAYAYGEGEGLM